MFSRLGRFVSRRWLLVICCWIAVVAAIRVAAPKWDDVTLDGDFEYLPDDLPSVQGRRLMEEAFPHLASQSQVALIVAHETELAFAPNSLDEAARDLTRRFQNINGAVNFHRAKQFLARAQMLYERGERQEAQTVTNRAHQYLLRAASAFNHAINADAKFVKSQFANASSSLAALYHNSALFLQYVKSQDLQASLDALARQNPVDDAVRNLLRRDQADQYYKRAVELDAQFEQQRSAYWPDESEKIPLAPHGVETLPVLNVWSWDQEYVGEQLTTRMARLLIVHLDSEFMAVENLQVMEHFRREVNQVRKWLADVKLPSVIGISGSAAVGADLLTAAKDSITNTELFTILLVTLILLLVYRSPLLVAVPLITIGVSFVASAGIVALLTQLDNVPGFEWWNFQIFKTTRIFIVVILFGAGTDYCLFLISRYREELQNGLDRQAAVGKAMAGVGDALAASALTTIIGLAMMFFAEFGKFRNSGPAIGLCLAVTLLASLTLAPALLRAMGRIVFWPLSVRTEDGGSNGRSTSQTATERRRMRAFWQWTSRRITNHPGLILAITFVLLSPLAWFGVCSGGNVTYDLLSELDASRPSRQATRLLAKHFPVGESGTFVILAKKDGVDFDKMDAEVSDAVWKLSKKLCNHNNVLKVRNFAAPFEGMTGGQRKTTTIFSLRRASPLVRSLYVSPVPKWNGSVTRIEVVPRSDAFSLEATETLSDIDQMLRRESADPDSFWSGATFAFTGTTAAMRDLRDVTRRDNVRIEILVVIAVFVVLLIILRRPLVCAYMIVTVLFTYFVTIGATEWFFRWAYGETFHGLDWKVPLFLFVILVAVGQDYNVYLATRVFEEQQRRGPFAGLRYAVERTGGIITSCGVIMAGTFISMTSGTWGQVLPAWLLAAEGSALRGIVELGFALALGVMLDTFIVRPILLPAFLALLCKWRPEK